VSPCPFRRPHGGFATINPFIITRDAAGLIEFLKRVFDATERAEARTIDGDGMLLHAELSIGNATVMVGERKPDWPFTPALLQIYVDDLETTLDTARRLGATVVTEPTEFYGDTFSRFRDPWRNLWWVYRHGGPSDAGDGQMAAGWGDDDSDDDSSAGWEESSPELTYIHDTLLTAMRDLPVTAGGVPTRRRAGA
jgi:PhnB protein